MSTLINLFEAIPLSKAKEYRREWNPDTYKDLFGGKYRLYFPLEVEQNISVEPDVRPLPKSLINIYKEISEDMGIDLSDRNGDLRHWAEQGVLLLNATLTVREGTPESHANRGWEKFTDAVIKALSERNEHVVYMLWGSKAAKKAEHVPGSKNCILNAPHPSPLSAYRGFFGCNHFSEANKYLTEMGKTPIKW